jgi:hypothetical protein
MAPSELKSPSYEVDESEAVEFYYDRGWSDGLPVVPPTEERVRAMLAGAGLEPGEQIAFIETRQAAITAEKAAINAVMAGCRPEYMPVIVAALEAMADPVYGYHGPATSTGGAAVLMVINGPAALELDINSGDNLLGPGWRANATIGRAVRLIMRNVIGTLPGTLDRSTIGHAGKYTFCFAEDEKNSPWTPLHVEGGFRPEQSTVTIFAALAPHQWYNHLSNTGEGVLETLCGPPALLLGGVVSAPVFPGLRRRTQGDPCPGGVVQGKNPAVLFRQQPGVPRGPEAHPGHAGGGRSGRRGPDEAAGRVARGFCHRGGGQQGRRFFRIRAGLERQARQSERHQGD